jgi:hypothetical protein
MKLEGEKYALGSLLCYFLAYVILGTPFFCKCETLKQMFQNSLLESEIINAAHSLIGSDSHLETLVSVF